eukprot:6491733-Amphidinium_carterae.2
MRGAISSRALRACVEAVIAAEAANAHMRTFLTVLASTSRAEVKGVANPLALRRGTAVRTELCRHGRGWGSGLFALGFAFGVRLALS